MAVSIIPTSSVGQNSVTWLQLIARKAGKCSQSICAGIKGNKFSEQVASFYYIKFFHLPEILKE
jgi:hypothetical protein